VAFVAHIKLSAAAHVKSNQFSLQFPIISPSFLLAMPFYLLSQNISFLVTGHGSTHLAFFLVRHCNATIVGMTYSYWRRDGERQWVTVEARPVAGQAVRGDRLIGWWRRSVVSILRFRFIKKATGNS
jgi:hypothetical protein